MAEFALLEFSNLISRKIEWWKTFEISTLVNDDFFLVCVYDSFDYNFLTEIYTKLPKRKVSIVHVYSFSRNFFQNPPFTWSFVSVVVAKNARRRITPLPKRSNTSIRKLSFQSWNTTELTIMAKFTVWDANAQLKNVEPVFSWPPMLIVNIVANVVWLTCLTPWMRSK